MNIYKFMSFSDEKITALYGSTIWFSDRSKLNDPYESILGPLSFSLSSLDHDEKKKLNLHLLNITHAKGALIPILQRHSSHPNSGNDSDHLVALLSSNQNSKIEEALNFLSNSDSNSIITPVATKVYMELSNKILGQAISCFFQEGVGTTKADFFLMWSHYADGFRGFSLMFDSENIFESTDLVTKPQKVTYSNERYPVDPLKLLYQSLIEENQSCEIKKLAKYRAFKFDCWSYENEIRYFSNTIGLKKFDSKTLKKFLIGEKMPLWQQQVLIHLAKEVFPHASVELVKLSNETFDLEFELIHEHTKSFRA